MNDIDHMTLLIGKHRPITVDVPVGRHLPWKHVSFARWMALQAIRIHALNRADYHDLVVRAAWECHGPGVCYYAPKNYYDLIFRVMVSEYMTAVTGSPMSAGAVEIPEWFTARSAETSAGTPRSP